MKKVFLLLLQIGISVSGILDFLTAVKRSNTSYTDYYFCCDINGTFLSWEYNHKPLSAFRTDDVGEVRLDERADYTYTATLLSSQPTYNNEAKMDSILVISFHNDRIPDNFSATCSSNRNIYTTFSQGVSSVEKSVQDKDIHLDYIKSGNIVNTNFLSHIFICVVHQWSQFFKVTGPTLTGQILSFSRFDNIGRARTILSEDRNRANVQGIIMAGDSSVLIALVIVSLNGSVESVTCGDSENFVDLSLAEVISSDDRVVIDYGTTETEPATESPSTNTEESTNSSKGWAFTEYYYTNHHHNTTIGGNYWRAYY